MIVLRNATQVRVNLPPMGWQPDPPDKKDWMFSATKTVSSVTAAALTNLEMDLEVYFRPVSDQMQFPSCTANAGADTLEAVTVVEKVGAELPLQEAIDSTPDASRMFLWYNGRQMMDPPQGSNAASGCHNRLVVDSIARFGVPTETEWPYAPENATRRPSLKAYREAKRHMCLSYYGIGEAGNRRASLVRVALGSKLPVIFGGPIGVEFQDYAGGSKVLGYPQGEILGGHAMVICGWNPKLQAFKVRNSWSKYWGNNGYCWLHADYIANPNMSGFWVISKGSL